MQLPNVFPKNSMDGNFGDLRPGAVLDEYHEIDITGLSSGDGAVEVPTNLDEIIGIVPINYQGTLGHAVINLTTDCIKTAGAITVEMTSDTSLTEYKARFYIVGRKLSQS